MMTAADAVSHAESCECMPCKLRFWRRNGLQTSIPQGWRGPSVKAKAERQYNEAKAAGYDPVPVGNRWV